MEHVAPHIENPGKGDYVVFRGEEDGDNTLVEWASCPDVAIIERKEGVSGWVLKNLLQKEPYNRLHFR